MGLAEALCFTARFPGSADASCKPLSSELGLYALLRTPSAVSEIRLRSCP
ncbi:hypothetical protein CTAM01_13387 [Colletotrichum tamarilloi]|uniref:Uncharacterized protein n=1 Tax=Colletotrichum tamarilloi TaxID=1209934 RepID=A0ABQ9QS97_9PEZI|nr:uncharacterized protein CTAM01_13387 [Colletotrichum tamarilloi]KAK1483507.1 hypothetical protein CTAM01_13387 [Colletotrichum tamarilloi]